MRKVSDILNRKGNNVVSVSPETTVIDALRIMAEKNIGSVVVVDNGSFAGILTERDYSRKVILKGRHSSDTQVGEIMVTDFPSIKKSDSIEICMQLMSNNNLRYLPVMENGELAGVISMTDLVTETIRSQAETINHLQSYIHS